MKRALQLHTTGIGSSERGPLVGMPESLRFSHRLATCITPRDKPRPAEMNPMGLVARSNCIVIPRTHHHAHFVKFMS